MFTRFKPQPIPRTADIDDGDVALAMGGRFTDELLFGMLDFLMPAIRAGLGLSYIQVSLLFQALHYVGLAVELVNGLLIDLWPRRRLMAFGAAAIGLSIAGIGLAPTFLALLVGFACYGLGSGPLAHTADVVLVESHPQAPDRIFARATLFDTLGAMLAPLAVTAVSLLGLEWRWLLVAAGAGSLVYAGLLLRARFPAPLQIGRDSGGTAVRLPEGAHDTAVAGQLLANLRAVLASRAMLAWLLFLFAQEVQELPMTFATIWLREEAGLSLPLVGLYRAMQMAVALISLAYLDRWRARTSARRILQTANLGLLILFPAWFLLPGVATRFIIGAPMSFLMAVYWPIGRAQLLVSVPGRAGMVTAVQSVLGLIPLSLLFGLLAEAVRLTTAMLWVSLGATAVLLLVVRRLPAANDQQSSTHS